MGELIVNGIKWSFFISVALVFMSAITSLLNLVVSVVFANVIGEVLGLISMCLPFNADIVFGGIVSACAGILGFMVANKIWDLTSNRLSL